MFVALLLLRKNQLILINLKDCVRSRAMSPRDFTFTLSPKEFFDLFAGYFTKLLSDLDNISDLESHFLPKYENYQIIKGKVKMTQLPNSRPEAL